MSDDAPVTTVLGGDGDPLLWVLFHGWTDRHRFCEDVRIHEHVDAAYPKAPSPIWGWRRGNSEWVIREVGDVWAGLNEPDLVFAFHSKACQPGHYFAQEAIAAELPVVCVVHYAGFWMDELAPCPCVPICNFQDRNLMRRGTNQCAAAYGTSVLWVDGGEFTHRWNPENNETIIHAVKEAISR